MFERLANWMRRRRPSGRTFEAFQLEVTTRCVLRCVMCPRAVLADAWREIDLSWETFQRIAQAFPLARHVHLQGWGEPLLHPRLFDMIALAKAAGCRVGLTTNGMKLDRDAAGQLLDLNLDLLAVSIAGARADTHERIRIGSDLGGILENVRRLLTLRREQGKDRPKVEFSYLMTRTNIPELPEAVDMAASLGADELYATNLDYVITPEHDALKAFDCPPPLCTAFEQDMEDARARANRAGLAFRAYPLNPEAVAVCEANPTKILFISCEGQVSPCPYLALPGQAEIPRRFQGRLVRVPVVRFGDVRALDCLQIWEAEAYREFRHRFLRRQRESMTRSVAAATWVRSFDADLPPAPESCSTCHKLYGI